MAAPPCRARASSASTAAARPVRPAFVASVAISGMSVMPTASSRSPSFTPAIVTVSDSRDRVLRNQDMETMIRSTVARRSTAAIRRAPENSSSQDDIVAGCEKSGKNRQGRWKAWSPARGAGRGQHDDDRGRHRRAAGTGEADRLTHSDGHDPSRQTHREPFSGHQGFRSAQFARRHRFRRLGHLRGQLLRSGDDGRCPRKTVARTDQAGARTDSPDAGGLRPAAT